MKKKVLIVDDEASMLEIVGRTLTDAGYEIGRAENGVEGFRLFAQSRWDAVIVDRAMPGIDGEDLADSIKVLSPNVPIIMITGFTETIRRPELFNCIIAKPFRPGDLLTQLSLVLDEDRENTEAATFFRMES